MNLATINITVVNILTTIEASDTTTTINDSTIVIETIGATIALNAMTKT